MEKEKRIIYLEDAAEQFVSWFSENFSRQVAQQGWLISWSSPEAPNEKYVNPTSQGHFFMVERIDEPEEDEALNGKLATDLDAETFARHMGIMVDEYGVVYGYKGQLFIKAVGSDTFVPPNPPIPKTMYLAINKKNPNAYHSFTWSEKDSIYINGICYNANDFEIVQVQVITADNN